MKTDKIEYFRDPGVTLLQIIYIYIYIWKPSIAWIFFVCFIVSVVFFIFLAYQITPTIFAT